MNKAYLLTGGNLGERIKNLRTALELLAKKGISILKESSIYETAAWGKTDQPSFLNQALFIETKLDPQELLKTILQVEQEMGRERSERFGQRIIDIDILFYNTEIINSHHLSIPHPELQNRRFVLEPMKELAPGLVHPILKKTISDLAKECPDHLPVKRLEKL